MEAQRHGRGPPARGDVADRLEEGRPVGHVDPLQQAVAAQPRRRRCRRAGSAETDASSTRPLRSCQVTRSSIAESSSRSRASLSRIRSRQRALVAHVLQGLRGDVADRRDGEDRKGDAGARCPPSVGRRRPRSRRRPPPRTPSIGQEGRGERSPASSRRPRASSGIATSQTAAAELRAAGEAREADDQTGQAGRRDRVREPEGAGARRAARRRAPAATGWRSPAPRCPTARRARAGRAAAPAIITAPVARRETRKRSWRKRTPASSITDSWTSPARRSSSSDVRAFE